MSGTAPDTMEWIERLVAHDTTSARSNLPLIENVADYFDGLGIPVRLVHNETGQKANLFATIGPPETGGIVLSGHTDTVPVAGQPWDTDPFEAVAGDDRIFGRGTCDMKGFIACALALAPDLIARRLQTPIHFALSYDEEVGCLGVRPLIELIGDGLPRPEMVIVGEPTNMRVVDAHKGISQQTTTVVGRDGHSSRPGDGVNAVAYAAEIIGFLNRLTAEYRSKPGEDPRFNPPGTTFNIGTIQGGAAVNMIARECVFKWEFRPTPGTDAREILDRLDDFVEAEILPRMREVEPQARVETKVDITAPTLDSDAESSAVRLALRVAGANHTETESFVCEAGLFAEAGVPAVVCGPGSVDQAHRPNEFVTRAQIEACDAFLRRLTERELT